MNLVFLAHRELASALAVNLLAQRLREHTLRIFVSGEHVAFGDGAPSMDALEQAEQDMERELDVVCADGRLPLRSLDTLAREHGAPLQTLSKPNSPEGLETLRSAQPDLLLSVRYRHILHADAIAAPTRGVINWHSGLLPEYQGVMATFWAMRNADRHIGSTLHYIADRTIDTGPVIQRMQVECDYGQTYLDNVLRLYLTGVGKVAEAVRHALGVGTVAARAQRGEAAYFSAPSEADVVAFMASGRTLWDGRELDRLMALLEGAG